MFRFLMIALFLAVSSAFQAPMLKSRSAATMQYSPAYAGVAGSVMP